MTTLMTTPTLHLETLFVLDGQGRILHTREPGAAPGPLFFLARGETSCAWAVHADVPPPLAQQLTDLVQQETPAPDLRAAPIYAARYRSILEPVAGASLYPSGGVAFAFPKTLRQPTGVVPVTDEQLLSHNFSGWEPGEIEAGRGPMWAVAEAGIPISICFCARSSEQAAEAGWRRRWPTAGEDSPPG